jgi:hypothetical protein
LLSILKMIAFYVLLLQTNSFCTPDIYLIPAALLTMGDELLGRGSFGEVLAAVNVRASWPAPGSCRNAVKVFQKNHSRRETPTNPPGASQLLSLFAASTDPAPQLPLDRFRDAVLPDSV